MNASQVFSRVYEALGTDGSIADPGNAGVIRVNKHMGYTQLETAGAETRTLKNPTQAGVMFGMFMETDGGDCVVTVESAYDEAGGTTITFADVGQYVLLYSVKVSGNYRWRVMGFDGVTGPTIEMGALDVDTLTVDTAATITPAPTLSTGFKSTAQSVTANSTQVAGNTILPGVTAVTVAGVTTDANDFVVLPALADVPIGHAICIVGNASSNFEVRTPSASNEEINSEDCDGTKEYLFTDTQIHYFVKINNTIGWMGHGFSAIGAVVTAVVPD